MLTWQVGYLNSYLRFNFKTFQNFMLLFFCIKKAWLLHAKWDVCLMLLYITCVLLFILVSRGLIKALQKQCLYRVVLSSNMQLCADWFNITFVYYISTQLFPSNLFVEWYYVEFSALHLQFSCFTILIY